MADAEKYMVWEFHDCQTMLLYQNKKKKINNITQMEREGQADVRLAICYRARRIKSNEKNNHLSS